MCDGLEIKGSKKKKGELYERKREKKLAIDWLVLMVG